MSAAPQFQREPVVQWSTTAEVTAGHDRLARFVHGQFRRRLSLEDARDVAAQTIAEVLVDETRGRIRHLDALLHRAAHRNALDLIRRRDGEASTGPRPVNVPLDERTDSASPERQAERLAEVQARVRAHEALGQAMAALPVDESLALQLRHIDGLDVHTCAFVLGLSYTQFERLHTRAMNRLRDTLAEATREPTCRMARRLVDRGTLDDASAVRRDTHLESCLPCRAYVQRRARDED